MNSILDSRLIRLFSVFRFSGFFINKFLAIGPNEKKNCVTSDSIILECEFFCLFVCFELTKMKRKNEH